METVFHTGRESGQHLREFAEKRADFALRELRDFKAEELKALLCILQEENRTFEAEAKPPYNEAIGTGETRHAGSGFAKEE